MLLAISLTIAAAVVSAATPPQPPTSSITLPLKRFSKVKSVKTIIQKGRARLHHCNGNRPVTSNKVVGSGAVTNDDVSYIAAVIIGSGTWNLVIDTGCMPFLEQILCVCILIQSLSRKHVVRCPETLRTNLHRQVDQRHDSYKLWFRLNVWERVHG